MISIDDSTLWLLSELQIRAWREGKIDNLRFDPEGGILHYRIVAVPGSEILFKIPEATIEDWRAHQETRAV